MTNYEAAREKYAALGVDTDKAIETLKKVPVSLHCWQLDDVIGFDNDGGLTGGIQTTGNYMGRARTPEQLMADMEEAMRLMPGTAKLNIHASYAIFAPGEFADRDALEPKHFAKWVEFAKKHHMGIDFNPTFFSHEKVKDGQTLSSPDEETRRFWINHGKACIRISEYFAKETGMPCVMNIWTGDGFKDVPADRMGPRMRYKDSIEQILSEPYDHNLVKPCVESKVFGIGVESYTVGSAEFTLSFAALHDGCMPLMDNGHYHPLEYVSDKIPAMLCFYPEFALHITRGVRWDSDHVLILDDETKEMAKEIVRDNALDRVYMALDYFDASINRVSALATGFRSWQKALLIALCTPNAMLKALQDTNQMSKLMVMNEAVKMLPIGEIWDEVLRAFGESAPVHVVWFSSARKLAEGFYLDGEEIFYAHDGNTEKVINVNDLNLLGRHNYENVMAATAMSVNFGVPMEKIVEVLKRFQAVEHRIEYVTEKRGVRFYNDSKGTNPDAAIQGIRAMNRPTLLIGGGYDKQSTYDEWIDAFDGKVKKLVLIGQTAEKIEVCAHKHGFMDTVRCETFEEAIRYCYDHAVSGDAVLLSPACASWGMFPNYEERGRIFKEIVRGLEE